MDDNFLQDEEPTFGRATLELKSENSEYLNAQNASDSKGEASGTSKGAAPGISVPGIPYSRIDCHTFFSDRNEIVEKAIADCQQDLLSSTEEDELVGTWMLTEISIWDTEKERLLLLTKTCLYSVKYDLISLKILEYNRVSLSDIDTLVAGELIYPPTSLLPGRNMFGVRLMWNKGQPLSLDKKWNPFARDIPWITFTSHPLFWHKGSDSEKTKYNVQALFTALRELVPSNCEKSESPIIIENYVGLGSILHNRTGLGFFKIRGKFSF